ncbi:DUF1517 domain-containing protein [Meiothermus hypogaeus]|uniref:DUF1517 domain-containing protein n=1 Tax=Meiothermus hypogaeus TaxID=884155 RepID=UPI000E65AD25|nr:DUF1517 domain-containing protein [Meiothermus hypogaeus]
MRFTGVWILLLLWALAPLPTGTTWTHTSWSGWNVALAQRSGGGVGGRGGFSTPRPAPSIPRFNPELQANLRHMAQAADTENVRGLADLMDNAAVLLLREQAGWRFGMYEVWQGSLQKAEGQFDAWMTETRSEFLETYRHFEGKEVVQAGYQPKAEPDGRYILVTLLLAVSGSLPPVPTPLRREGARQALMALASSSPTNTLAAYVAWTPEAEGEALTEQDLLLGWPKLELL